MQMSLQIRRNCELLFFVIRPRRDDTYATIEMMHFCRGASGNGVMPVQLAANILPGAFDLTVLSRINRRDSPETLIWHRRKRERFIASLVSALDSSCSFKHPRENRTVGVVVEAVHAHRTKPGVFAVAVPAFPNRRCALIYRIEPARNTSFSDRG